MGSSGARGAQEKEQLVSDSSQSRGLIVAALILGLSFLLGSYWIARALDRTAAQIETTGARLAEAGSLEGGAAGRAKPRDSASARRPRPGKAQYDVTIGKAPVRGPATAPVTIVEFSDFQCPYCARVTPTLDRIKSEYGDDVRVVFKHLPLPNHSRAPAAHAAAEAAHRQGRFWEMHDKIFEKPRDLAPATFERYAAEIGLDLARYERDVESETVKQQVDADLRQARELGVNSTPAFFINGRYLAGAQPFENFKRAIDDALKKKS